LVSNFPSQIFEFNGASFDEFENVDFIKKPLKDEKLSEVCISSCEEENGNREGENIDTLFHIEKHRWSKICLYLYGDPICDIDSEILGLNF
jgi:hypothetical protein